MFIKYKTELWLVYKELYNFNYVNKPKIKLAIFKIENFLLG
jgi:hypothetical protein